MLFKIDLAIDQAKGKIALDFWKVKILLNQLCAIVADSIFISNIEVQRHTKIYAYE